MSDDFKLTMPEEGKLLRKQFTASEIKAADDSADSRIINFTISTSKVDRHGDIVDPKGWDLSPYKTNPVVLFAHDSSKPPIGRALDVSLKGKKLHASVEFMDNSVDTTGFSDTIFRMLKNGFLKATSVGFIPKNWEYIKEKVDAGDGEKIERITGIKFLEQELLEFSVVPVPANPDALMSAKGAGIDLAPLDLWFEEALDKWTEYKDCLLLPKKDIELLYNSVHKTVFSPKKTEKTEELDTKETQNSDTSKEVEEKTVITYGSAHSGGTPKADMDDSWDAGAEVHSAEVSDLLVMSAWRENKPRDELVKGDFKLPHHRSSDNHPVVWRGVAAAMAALMGARGGVDIPDNERRGVYNHLARHYREFDKEPPSFESLIDQVLANEDSPYEMDYATGNLIKRKADENVPEKEADKETTASTDHAHEKDVAMKKSDTYSATYKFGELEVSISTSDAEEFKKLHGSAIAQLLELRNAEEATKELASKSDTKSVEEKDATQSKNVSEEKSKETDLEKDNIQKTEEIESEEVAIEKETLEEVMGMLPQIIREVLDQEMKLIQGKVD